MSDSAHIVTDESGYAANVFAEKEDQKAQVCANLEQLGFLPKELVQNEVEWFYR